MYINYFIIMEMVQFQMENIEVKPWISTSQE